MSGKIRLAVFCACAMGMLSSVAAQVTKVPEPYTHRNSLGIFAEYANGSSHILLGSSYDRKLAGVGVEGSRRLLKSKYVDWYWMVEVHPLLLEEDPMEKQDVVYTTGQPGEHDYFTSLGKCTPVTAHFDYVDSYTSIHSAGTTTVTCEKRWTYSGGLSPVGQRLNFLPRRRVQPFMAGNGGFLVSANDIPIDPSSSFNFTFELGGGVEWYTSAKRSWSIEARYRHMSNAYTGLSNYGLDAVIYKATYRFGR